MKITNQYKEKIIDMYLNENMNASQIAKVIDCHHSTISLAIKKWGIKKKDMSDISRKFHINHNFFENIDSEQKAYWLGFIYADGYITTKNQIGISLSIQDKKHLEKFLKDIEADYEVKDYKSISGYSKKAYSRVLITSKKLFNDLKQNGVSESKSLILKFPEFIQANLLHHFIRGYFDGDGSIVISNIKSPRFKLCGTKEFLSSIIKVLNKEIPFYKDTFKDTLYKRKKDDKNTYHISFGGKNKVIAIMNYLYQDTTVYLDRKYSKYQTLKSNE